MQKKKGTKAKGQKTKPKLGKINENSIHKN
jgi:hypothetical protein